MYEVLPSLWVQNNKTYRRGDTISEEALEDRADSYRRLGLIRPIGMDLSKMTLKQLKAEAIMQHVVIPSDVKTKTDIAQLLEAT